MKYVKYDGVDFNVDVCFEMGREGFLEHRMHENHWPKLNRGDKRKKLNKVYNLILKIKGC